NPSARFIVPGQEGTFAFPPQQPPYPSETARLTAQYLPVARREQLREQAAASTEPAAAALWMDRLPELAARPLDGDATGTVIA
ncbi:hypothetical protein ACFRU3_49095, partial [Streptomyces sp. NPDC056910]